MNGGKMKGEEESKRRGEFFMGRRWERGILVGEREGNCTPSPSWNFGLFTPDGLLIQDSNFPTNRKPYLSARKLGAHLWEVQSPPKLSVANMSKYGPGLNHFGEEACGVFRQVGEARSEPSAEQSSGFSLRNQVALLLAEHNQRVQRVEQAQRAVSPSSYRSSLEMVPSRTAFTSNWSLNSNSEMGESSYTLKTSTDLLKVLNRIWSLEERHALDMSLVNMLKRELNESQSRIKELLLGKRRDNQELNDASKRVARNKVSRKNKEKEQVKHLGKSVDVKLEDERKLRKYSEKLCYKRVQELSATNVLLHDALEELELERKRRAMLENLCDEFASGIREYEQQVRFLKKQSSVDQIGRNGDSGLILHVSEAWLDERIQMKLADDNNVQKISVLDRLSSEIEIFLGAKRSDCVNKCDRVSSKRASRSNIFRHSLESIHLNDPSSGPWNANEEDDSDCIGVHFSQLNRVASLKNEDGFGMRHEVEITSDDHPKETGRLKRTKKIISSGKAAKNGFNWPSMQARSQEFVKERKHQLGNKDSSKASAGNTDETYNARMRRKTEVRERVSTSRNHSWASKIKKLEYEDNNMDPLVDPSTFTDPYSPVKKWISEATSADPNISESSSSFQDRTLKPNTLKAKLLEARLERQRSRARASKDLSQVD
ncbi:uncharacterized protein At5g41620-like isoform X2 [Henckelia pumila]|uniref:uncharacterized protein At5g41620-like isoform X2 n=1 Tax=Henckelia pumila TaxID=405737 RepID=UPI003C6DE220